jgi:hypothetical protein
MAGLPKALKPAAPPPPKPTATALLRVFRNFAAGAKRITEFNRLLPNISNRVESVLKDFGRTAGVFGAADANGVKDRVFAYLAELNIRATTKREFLDSSQGYTSNLAGEMLQWIIDADVVLRRNLQSWARATTDDLNRVATALRKLSRAQRAKAPERIVDARNNVVDLPSGGRFGESQRATDIWLETPDGGVRAFVDGMNVSLFSAGKAEPTHMSPVTLGQFKFRTAIRKALRQLADDPGRLDGAALLHFKIGNKSYSFPPDRIAFLFEGGEPRLNQYVVTNSDVLASQAKKPAPVYAKSIDDLLGATRPQVTPVARTVKTPGGPVDVNAVLIELNLDSRLVLAIARLFLSP